MLSRWDGFSQSWAAGSVEKGIRQAVINERTKKLRFFQQFVRFVRCSFMFWCTLGVVGVEEIRRQILKASGKLCVTAARNL